MNSTTRRILIFIPLLMWMMGLTPVLAYDKSDERVLFGALSHLTTSATPVFGSCNFALTQDSKLREQGGCSALYLSKTGYGTLQCAYDQALKNCQALFHNCVDLGTGEEGITPIVAVSGPVENETCETRAFVYGSDPIRESHESQEALHKDWSSLIRKYYLNLGSKASDYQEVYKAAQIFKTFPVHFPASGKHPNGFLYGDLNNYPYIYFYNKTSDLLKRAQTSCSDEIVDIIHAPFINSDSNINDPTALRNQIQPLVRTYYFACLNNNANAVQRTLLEMNKLIHERLKKHFNYFGEDFDKKNSWYLRARAESLMNPSASAQSEPCAKVATSNLGPDLQEIEEIAEVLKAESAAK